MKTHLKGIRRVIFYYLISMFLGWAGFLIIAVLGLNMAGVDIVLLVYTVLVTLFHSSITYVYMHEFGEEDRKPYKWSRYKAKGFVCGFVGFLFIILLECGMIAIADHYFIVSHPYFKIDTVNAYVTNLLYIPFYWFYKILQPGFLVPKITLLNMWFPVPYMTVVSGFGYAMGYSGLNIIKKSPQNPLVRRLLFGKKSNKKVQPKITIKK